MLLYQKQKITQLFYPIQRMINFLIKMMLIELATVVFHNYIKWQGIRFIYIHKIYTESTSLESTEEWLKLMSQFLLDLMFHRENKRKYGYLDFMKEEQKIKGQSMLKIDLNRL